MEGTSVGRNCTIEYAILDKEVTIEDGAAVVGSPENSVVVAKGTVVPQS